MHDLARSRVLLLFAVLSWSACAEDDDSVVDLGVIVAPGERNAVIEHPSTSQHGADVRVVVTTYGDDCTWLERTEVQVTGLSAVIKPFDRSAVHSVCADTLFSYEHAVTVRFEQTGVASITVVGFDTGDRFGDVIERSSTLEIQ